MAEFISNSAIWSPIHPHHRTPVCALDLPSARKMADFGVKSDIPAARHIPASHGILQGLLTVRDCGCLANASPLSSY